MKAGIKRFLQRSAIAVVTLAGSAAALFLSLPAILIAPSESASADVILHWVYSPQSDADNFVAQLYRADSNRKIVCLSDQVSWDVFPADFTRQRLIERGIPAESVLTLHLPKTECGAEQLGGIIEFVKQHNWRNVTMIVLPSESRMWGSTIRRHFTRAGLNLSVAYSPRDYETQTTNWWHTHGKAQQFVKDGLQSGLDLLFAKCR